MNYTFQTHCEIIGLFKLCYRYYMYLGICIMHVVVHIVRYHKWTRVIQLLTL